MLRNRAVAHSDAEMMRILVKLHQLEIRDGQTTPFFETVFDEGLDFVGTELDRVIGLIRKVMAALHMTLVDDARENPQAFNIRHNYLEE